MIDSERIAQITERIKNGTSPKVIARELEALGMTPQAVADTLAGIVPAAVTRQPWKGRILRMLAIGAISVISGGAALMYADYTGSTGLNFSLPGGDHEGLQYGALPLLARPDYYESVRTQFITDKETFIAADLSAMRLTVFVDGVETKTVPILAKGRKGSYWETPVGVYEIQTKEKNHFSSFGHVDQPWSMVFQGNFFIHGWPTYPDGTPVSSSFSGGCIRLSTEDAKTVYDLVQVGTPVVVFEAAELEDTPMYQLSRPEVSGTTYLVADLKTGDVLLSERAEEVFPAGRAADFLLSLVTVEHLNLERTIAAPGDVSEESRLSPYERRAVLDFLVLLLREGDEGAYGALREALGENRSLNLMNAKAKALGMQSTSIKSATTSSTVTAGDLFALAKHVGENRSFLFGLASGDRVNAAYEMPSFPNLGTIHTISTTLSVKGSIIDELPNGNTSGVVVATLPFGGSMRTLVFIVVDSENLSNDIQELSSHLHRIYEAAPLIREE